VKSQLAAGQVYHTEHWCSNDWQGNIKVLEIRPAIVQDCSEDILHELPALHTENQQLSHGLK
jgi:hypothetical protein